MAQERRPRNRIREGVVQGIVSDLGNTGDTLICEDGLVKAVGKVLAGAERAANLDEIGRVEVTAARELGGRRSVYK